MISLAQNGYTAVTVDAALHSANRTLKFRYELLNSSNQLKSSLVKIIGGSVANNAFSQIKRTARFDIRDDGAINYLSDRIKPYARFQMADGGYAEFALGVFILSTPPTRSESTSKVTRNVEAYDLSQILVDDKISDRYTIASGTNYIVAIKAVLDGAGITIQNLTATSSVLPTAMDWPPNTTKLQICNDLLGAINYQSIVFDENGTVICQPYVPPASRASDYIYVNDNLSVIVRGSVERAFDLFGIPNKWTLVVGEPDRSVLISTYTNSNPASPTSTVNRGRTIMDYRNNQQAVDQATLDALAVKTAFEASQAYEYVTFETAIMPMHGDLDVYTFIYSDLGINGKYTEDSWEFELKAATTMKHKIRRVVSI